MEEQLTEEESEQQSMETINAATELFPMKLTQWDDDQLVHNNPPFTTLCGEYISHVGLTTDGIIAMSNYRLFIKSTECGIFNVPLFAIDQVDASEYEFWVHCKNLHLISCKFSSSNKGWTWYHRVNSIISCMKKLEDLFTFAFYSWCCQEKEELIDTLQYRIGAVAMDHEIKRLGFDCDLNEESRTWRITKVNADYSLCPTYPSHIIVPNNISDEAVASGAQFRSNKRFPAIVWRSKKNGCVIARCSQPEVGLLGWRGKDDEEFVQAIAQACYKSVCHEDTPVNEQNGTVINKTVLDKAKGKLPSKLLIVDARSYSAAIANRAKGGGSENPAYYDNCEVCFMNLPNIHCVRKSFIAVRALCEGPPEDPNWLTTLDSSKWLHYLSALLQSAKCVVNAINNEKRPVIVHCSDGWDRTPQITALSQLLLDPHYRTIEGFQILVEREWLQFGHKFGDRCGHGMNEDTNERSPIFLQWLDCVHQLLIQYPCYFEFNEAYLVKISQHVYSCLFGTFLCNSENERYKNRVKDRTFSVWSFFKSYQTHFKNYLFTYVDKVLYPRCYTRDLVFWSSVYSPFDSNRTINSEENEITTAVLSNGENCVSNAGGLIKTKSCDDLSVNEQNFNVTGTKQRRLSDPSLLDIQCAKANNQTTSEAPHCPHDEEKRNLETTNLPMKAEENAELEKDVVQASETNGHVTDSTVVNKVNAAEADITSELDNLSNSESGSSLTEESLKNRLISGVNSSTDTLVSEAGTVSSSYKLYCDNNNMVNKQSCDDLVSKNDACRLSRSTSTSEISESYMLPDTTNGAVKQSWLSSFHRGVNQSCIVSSQKPKMKSFSRKTNNSSSLNSICSNSLDSRTPSSGFPATPSEECRVLSDQVNSSVRSTYKLEDIDGLNVVTDSVQQQLLEVLNKHKSETESLKRELYAARLDMCQQVGNRCNNNNNGLPCPDHGDEVISLPDSTLSGELCVGHESNDTECSWEHVNDKELLRSSLWTPEHAAPSSSQYGADCWLARRKHVCRCSSLADAANATEQSLGHDCNGTEHTWEHVNENETRPTLWVPDHAVSQCSECGVDFWLGRRKHHCRCCGRIFCSKCSDHLAPIPDEQLYYPVRVCRECFEVLYTRFKPNPQWSSMMSCSSGCKNRMVSKSQSVRTAEALN